MVDINTPDNAREKRNARSKVSNGTRLFSMQVDGRSEAGRRFKDLVYDIVTDLGGRDLLSENQLQLVRRTSMISAICERMEAEVVQERPIDVEQYVLLANCQSRICKILGLKRIARSVNVLEDLGAISAHLGAEKPPEEP